MREACLQVEQLLAAIDVEALDQEHLPLQDLALAVHRAHDGRRLRVQQQHLLWNEWSCRHRECGSSRAAARGEYFMYAVKVKLFLGSTSNNDAYG